MLEEARERARERQLGSDARAGRRVRDQIRRAQWDYVRRHWRFLGVGALFGALVTAVAAVLAANVFLRGAVVGAGVVFVLGGLAFTVFMFTGSGPQTMGAIAETWTSSELRPLCKHGWKLIDHVFYRFADVDHLLVGPGGAVVAETKWSAEAWRLDAPDRRLLDHVDGLQRRARDVRIAIPQLRRSDVEVRPVLFVWGGDRTGIRLPAEPVRVGTVDVVYGVVAAKVWRDAMGGAHRSSSVAMTSTRSGCACARRQRRLTSRTSPNRLLPPLARIYWTASATALAAVLGLLGGIYALRLPGGAIAGYVVTAAVAAAVGIAARRFAALRYPALGLLTGAGFALLLSTLELFG